MRNHAMPFLIRLCVVYGVFVVPRPFVQSAYASTVVAVANSAYSMWFRGGMVVFSRAEPPRGRYDVAVLLVNYRDRAAHRGFVSSRVPAFHQTLLLVALVIATPWPKRRSVALLTGLGALHLVLFGQFLLLLTCWFAEPQIGVVHVAPSTQWLLDAANWIATYDIVALLMIPLAIWVVLLLVFDCEWFAPAGDSERLRSGGIGKARRERSNLRGSRLSTRTSSLDCDLS